jgi:hypothetical protein
MEPHEVGKLFLASLLLRFAEARALPSGQICLGADKFLLLEGY